jgi:uncharacterized membrane protein YqaE (UPF0057 family)
LGHLAALSDSLGNDSAPGVLDFDDDTDKGKTMRLILAILIPWLQFFTIGRPFAGLICLILQITLIGWIPAAIWSVYALSQYETDRKIKTAFGRF